MQVRWEYTVPEDTRSMICQDITIPVDGSTMDAHIARPEEGSGPHPAVIVLQEVFGFSPETKRVTELLPSMGYVGLAINYYHRTNPNMIEPYTEEGNRRAFAAAAQVTAQNLISDVGAAAAWLNQQPFVRDGKVATWGFGFGATAAFITLSLRELSGAICFYPMYITTPMPSGGEPPIEHVDEAAIPLLLVFGDEDYYVPRHDMDRINQALTDAGKNVRMEIYPDVGHSFFRHGSPQAIAEVKRYSDEAIAQAVADSWNVVRAFLSDIFSRSGAHAVESGEIHMPHTQSVR
jgi:carboxymethylenebutenolidase